MGRPRTPAPRQAAHPARQPAAARPGCWRGSLPAAFPAASRWPSSQVLLLANMAPITDTADVGSLHVDMTLRAVLLPHAHPSHAHAPRHKALRDVLQPSASSPRLRLCWPARRTAGGAASAGDALSPALRACCRRTGALGHAAAPAAQAVRCAGGPPGPPRARSPCLSAHVERRAAATLLHRARKTRMLRTGKAAGWKRLSAAGC